MRDYQLEFGHFPEGDPSYSPGLLYSATLGKAAEEFPNPNGVRPILVVYTDPAGSHCLELLSFIDFRGSLQAEGCRNPIGVARIIPAIPKVAEYSNLGLWDATTLWLPS